MKKLLYTFLAVSIIFSACKKEDEGPTNSTTNATGCDSINSSHSIIGAWTINTVIVESDTSSSTFSPEDIGFPSSLEFVAGGILYEIISNELDTNEWVIIADSLYVGDGGENFIGKHLVTNTNLTLVGPMDGDMSGITATINGTRD